LLCSALRCAAPRRAALTAVPLQDILEDGPPPPPRAPPPDWGALPRDSAARHGQLELRVTVAAARDLPLGALPGAGHASCALRLGAARASTRRCPLSLAPGPAARWTCWCEWEETLRVPLEP